MKILRRVVFILILLVMIFSSFLIKSGYDIYIQALKNMPLDKKVERIKEIDNYTKIDEVPQIYINAVISVEDHRFYTHNGIDLIAIGRAAVNDIIAMRFAEGGSTITQQLSKNIYFTQEKKITRKIAEVFMAWEIEKNYEKDEILELYLNTSYYGDGYYGLKEASLGYFNKSPNELTLAEASLLAGLPNAPSAYSPTKNPKLAQKRHSIVLTQMVKYEYISEEQKQEIVNTFQQ